MLEFGLLSCQLGRHPDNQKQHFIHTAVLLPRAFQSIPKDEAGCSTQTARNTGELNTPGLPTRLANIREKKRVLLDTEARADQPENEWHWTCSTAQVATGGSEPVSKRCFGISRCFHTNPFCSINSTSAVAWTCQASSSGGMRVSPQPLDLRFQLRTSPKWHSPSRRIAMMRQSNVVTSVILPTIMPIPPE